MTILDKMILEVGKINKDKNVFLTPIQFTTILTSALIGGVLLYLPNEIAAISQQDSWISCLLGSLYPLYIVIIANYTCKKFPRDNILKLSKKCFGKICGTILNFIFISFFLFALTAELSGFSFVYIVYSTPFLKSYQLLLVTLIPIAFISYKGIKTLGRFHEVGFFITILSIFLLLPVLKYGSILNLMPVFGSGFTNIIKGSKDTINNYAGMEMIFLIYPFLQDSKKLLKYGIVATAITTSIFTLVVLATIFYLGVETTQTYLWPVLSLADSINIPVINSFRFIFIPIWAFVVFKCISTYYFAVSYGLNQSIKKISAQKFTLLLYPLIILISLLYKNPTMQRDYPYKLGIFYMIFNLVFISTIAIIIHFKKGDNIEKV